MVNYDGPGQGLAKALAAQSQLPVSSSIGYATPGSFGTFYGKEQGIPVITFETGYESPEKAWARYRKALLAFLQYPHPNLEPAPLAHPKPNPTPSLSPAATPSGLPQASPSAPPMGSPYPNAADPPQPNAAGN